MRGKQKKMKMELLFASKFHSGLERCLTDAAFVVLVNKTAAASQLFYQ